MSKTVKGPTPGARCSYVQSGGNSAKGLDQDIPPVCCRPFEAQPVGAFIVGCCYYLCTTTRLAADYSRQQVMEVVVIGLELPLGSLKAHIRERSWVRCDHCRVDPPLHPLRPPKPSFLPQAFQPKAYFTKNSDRWLMNRPWRRKAADRSAGDERSCNKERKICACF